MTAPYVYTDPDGDRLEILPSLGSGVILSVLDMADGEHACISLVGNGFERFVRALYETAGLPVPVLVFPVNEAEDAWVPDARAVGDTDG